MVSEFSHAMKLSLAPGPHLDEQNERIGKRALIEIDALLNPLHMEGSVKVHIKLLEWARHAITQASSCGVYGTKHPFLDPGVERAFW